MQDKKTKLEQKIMGLIHKMNNAPIGQKDQYAEKLGVASNEYKDLTGDYFRIETWGGEVKE